MDSNTDDRDPEVPPDVPADELQQALQWLEELTGSTTNSPTTDETADSPFHGLVDDGAGDLPDWLREAPKETVEPRLTDEGEFESRLDWLAKMAERESIEELPTLEWRNLSGTPPTTDDAALPADDTLPPTPLDELLPVEVAPSEPLIAEAILHVSAPLPDEASLPAIALEAVTPQAEAPTMPLADEPTRPLTVEPVTPITPEALLDSLPLDEELPPIDDLDAAMAWIEELAASQDAPIEDVPSVADRALASKLLMEAGLSPDGLNRRLPGDELALGDLSLLEGNTPINAFVAAEDFADTIVLVETMAADQGRSLPDEYVARETPHAPEASLAEAMAFLDEMAADQESLGAQTQPLEALDTPAVGTVLFITEELPLEEGQSPVSPVGQLPWASDEEEPAAPWLTELEDGAQPEANRATEPTEDVMELDTVEPERVVMAETTDRLELGAALATGYAPGPEATGNEPAGVWLEPEADRVAVVEAVGPAAVLAAEGVNANGNTMATLEETLRALDALALPPGRSLAEFDAALSPAPARRDLPAAVEWLELALGISVPTTPPTPQWSDDELISQMPDDPDAVLAWLEQLAEEDTVDSSPQLSPTTETLTDAGQPPAARLSRDPAAPEPLIDELSAADLQDMPDDPDAVIAWLEGLAGGHGEVAMTPPSAPARPEAARPSVPPMPPAPPTPSAAEQTPPAYSGRSRRRRGRKPQQAVVVAESDAAAVVPPLAEAGNAPDWKVVDDVAVPAVTMAPATPNTPPVVVAGALAWEVTDEVAALDFIETAVLPDAPPVEGADAAAWEEIVEVAAPDVSEATVTPDTLPVEAVDGPTWQEIAEIAAPDAPPVEVAGALAWEATDEVATPEITIEAAESVATAQSDAADIAPRVEAEVDEPAVTWVEEVLAAPAATDEPLAEPAVLPLPAGPRRRGRKPKAAPEASGAAAEFTTVDATGDTAETRPQPPEIEEAPPPAKPASWVDLLKPLK